MLSRPVKPEELQAIKSEAITQPVAFVVGREALGVFVQASNPLQSITGEQLRAVFTKQTKDAELKWKLLGVTGPIAEQPIHLVLRAETSGTQSFLRDFVFGGMEMRTASESHGSNSDVLGALAQDPLAITICGLRANGYGVRSLPLVRGGVPIPSSDADVLNGRYPLTRSLTLVVDLGQEGPEAQAAREMVHFALCRAGQLSTIRAGFFPAELPMLKAGLNLLQRDQLR
jgi:phosphate transport system substrate-binding protein